MGGKNRIKLLLLFSIKYLLVDSERIRWQCFTCHHFNAIRHEVLACKLITVADVKNDAVQRDVVANVEILPRIEIL